MQRLETSIDESLALTVKCPYVETDVQICVCFCCSNFRGTYKKNYGYRESIQARPDKVVCAMPKESDGREQEPKDIQG